MKRFSDQQLLFIFLLAVAILALSMCRYVSR
jgi:hypothetical protein